MGIFSGFNADVADLPEVSNNGPEAGVYDATLSMVEVRDDVFKQGDGSKYLCFDYTIEGYSYPKTMNFQLPDSPAPWDDTVTFQKINDKEFTEKSTMEYRLARIASALEDLGVPREKQDDVNPSDLVDLKVVLTLRGNKKGYVNAVSAKVKKESSLSLPGQTSTPAAATSSPSNLWG